MNPTYVIAAIYWVTSDSDAAQKAASIAIRSCRYRCAVADAEDTSRSAALLLLYCNTSPAESTREYRDDKSEANIVQRFAAMLWRTRELLSGRRFDPEQK